MFGIYFILHVSYSFWALNQNNQLLLYLIKNTVLMLFVFFFTFILLEVGQQCPLYGIK